MNMNLYKDMKNSYNNYSINFTIFRISIEIAIFNIY